MEAGWVIFALVCLYFTVRYFVMRPPPPPRKGPPPPPDKLPPLIGNMVERGIARRLLP